MGIYRDCTGSLKIIIIIHAKEVMRYTCNRPAAAHVFPYLVPLLYLQTFRRHNDTAHYPVPQNIWFYDKTKRPLSIMGSGPKLLFIESEEWITRP